MYTLLAGGKCCGELGGGTETGNMRLYKIFREVLSKVTFVQRFGGSEGVSPVLFGQEQSVRMGAEAPGEQRQAAELPSSVLGRTVEEL